MSTMITVKMSTFLGDNKDCSFLREQTPQFLKRVRQNIKKKLKFLLREFYNVEVSMTSGKISLDVIEKTLHSLWENFPLIEDGQHRLMSQPELAAVEITVQKLREHCNNLKESQRNTTNLIAYITGLRQQYHESYLKCKNLHRQLWPVILRLSDQGLCTELQNDVKISIIHLRRKSQMMDDMYQCITMKSEQRDEIATKMEGLLERTKDLNGQNTLTPHSERISSFEVSDIPTSGFMGTLNADVQLPAQQQLQPALLHAFEPEFPHAVSSTTVERLAPIIENAVERPCQQIMDHEYVRVHTYENGH